MKNSIVGALFIGVAVSLLVGHLILAGDPRVVPIAAIIGFVGTLLR